MSVRVQTYVWQLELAPALKLVAIALADHCNNEGYEARPSQQLLADKTGYQVRHVRRILNELVDLGVIVLDRKSNQHQANSYRFPLPDDFARLPRAVTQSRSGLNPGRTFAHTDRTSATSRAVPQSLRTIEPSFEPNDKGSEIVSGADASALVRGALSRLGLK
jgi:hypothetical protein